MTVGSRAEYALSVVVGSNGAAGSVEGFLEHLEPQVDGAEVVVCESTASTAAVQERFPFARFLERPGALVPVLWKEGIDNTSGRLVALTISPMRPAPDWIATIRAQLERVDVVAGAIDPGRNLRLSDWAEYFVRYSRDMLPFDPHECLDLPGDNAAYKRELLEQARDVFRDGFWEPDVHRRLRERGALLWHAPELVVRLSRSAGPRAFARQRLAHGRVYGAQRGRGMSALRQVAGVLGSPLVPPLLIARVLRETYRRGRLRGRLLAALPLIVVFDCAWAAGEAIGHLDALRRR